MANWNDFLALAGIAPGDAATAAAGEREARACFEAAYAAYRAENDRLMAATVRAPADLSSPADAYAAVDTQMTAWLAACDTYADLAARLRAAGDPTLATRRDAVVADTAAARATVRRMAAAAAAGQADVAAAVRGMGDAATEQVRSATAAWQKAFDAMNKGWR